MEEVIAKAKEEAKKAKEDAVAPPIRMGIEKSPVLVENLALRRRDSRRSIGAVREAPPPPLPDAVAGKKSGEHLVSAHKLYGNEQETNRE